MKEKERKPKIRFKGFTNAWKQRKFKKIFNYERPEKYIVSSNEYESFGKVPVLTANKSFILGYTDESNVYDKEKESIIFDDFTLDTKFVDFPYMVKSSAIKILTLKNKFIDNLRFNYELLSNTKFNILGHARHYIAVVQHEKVYTTKINEQNKIAKLFANIDSIIALYQRKYDKLVNIKRSLLEKMFPKNGSKKPEIRFKGFTDAWKQRKLGKLGTILTGNTPPTNKKEYYSNDGIQWVTPTDISSNIVTKTEKKLSKEGSKVGRIVPPNTILVTCIASIGKNAIVTEKSAFNQQINSLTPKKHNPYFLLSDSSHWSESMKKAAGGLTFQIINKSSFSEIETKIPSKLKEEEKIGTFFKQLDALINLHQRKLEKLKNVKKSLIEKMFV